jgi:hypothetical protein
MTSRLTSRRRPLTISDMRSWRRVIVCMLVLTAFSASAWASCFGDSEGPQPMACCHAGHEQCPMHDSAAACCPTVSTSQPQATVVKAATAVAPTLRVFATPVAHTPSPATSLRHREPHTSPPRAPRHSPPYIAFSTLLL